MSAPPPASSARRRSVGQIFGPIVTIRYPEGPAPTEDGPPRTPWHRPERCDGLGDCGRACPTGALQLAGRGANPTVSLDYGKCLFCERCVDACPSGAMASVPFFELAVTRREDLISIHPSDRTGPTPHDLPTAVSDRVGNLFAGSLALREVDAGSCNGCEVEVQALTWPKYDLERLGIHFVASPRHADGLLVTGPVTANMRLALEKTYRAMPRPAFVIAVGACGISGGPFAGSPEVANGVDEVVPVEVYVPGCPPSPLALLFGLWLALGKVEQRLIRGRIPDLPTQD